MRLSEISTQMYITIDFNSIAPRAIGMIWLWKSVLLYIMQRCNQNARHLREHTASMTSSRPGEALHNDLRHQVDMQLYISKIFTSCKSALKFWESYPRPKFNLYVIYYITPALGSVCPLPNEPDWHAGCNHNGRIILRQSANWHSVKSWIGPISMYLFYIWLCNFFHCKSTVRTNTIFMVRSILIPRIKCIVYFDL